jgi:S1-C subfamily serine protease
MDAPMDAVHLRDRLVPRTVLGLSVLILAFAIGAGFSGVVFYSYYEFRRDTSEKRTASFVEGFDERFKTAQQTIEAERENAKSEIQKELEPLKKIRAEGQTLEELVKKVGPATWFVRTLDAAGQPAVGSAFVVASDNSQSLMLTSFTTVEAATRSPGPQVTVRKGDQELKATVWTWQADRDIALLIVAKGSQPKLDFADNNPPLKAGERVFAVSGLGAAGAAVTQGFVADVSSAGVQHDASVGQAFQGGPLVNSDGEVLAVSSRSYAPLGFRSDAVWFGVPIRMACDRVLKCPSGAVGGAGDRSQQTPANPPPG